jgi:hypothetical protein
MIKMKQPSLVLHAEDVPGYRYKMSTTRVIAKTMPVPGIFDLIADTVDKAPEMRLNNVILNSHGLPGKIFMGTGITISDTAPFETLKAKDIGCIWIVACLVGATKYKTWVLDGPAFCSTLAVKTRTFVCAADVIQSVDAGFEIYSRLPFTPSGNIDRYEGTLTRYDPSGKKKIIGNSGEGLWDG